MPPRDGSAGPRGVLVTEGARGQGRSAVAAVRALAVAGYEPVVTTTGGRGPAAASRHCSATVPVPPVSSPEFAETVRAELRTGRYVGALPVSDAAIAALGLDDAVALLDKDALERRARAAGLEGVPGRVFPSPAAVRAAAQALSYPLVVKAARASAQGHKLPATRIDTMRGLGVLPPDTGALLVQAYRTEPMRSIAGVAWSGRLVATVHQRYVRTWPISCGTSSYAVSVAADRDLEGRLLHLLDGYRGIFQAQFVGPYLIDMNPRVYGSLPLAVAAGVNLPAILCDLVRGAEVEERRGRPGVAYRWVEGDLRHVLHAVRGGRMGWREALAALRPRRGTAHSVASLRDPGPFVEELRHAARRWRR